MARDHLTTGSTFEEEVGYSRAVVDDDWVFVAGTSGFDYDTMEIVDDVEAQCARALATIANVLARAGSSLDDVARVRYLVPDPDDFPPCWPLLRAAFATARRRAP